MVGFHNPLSNILHPHGHSSSRQSAKAKAKAQRNDDDEAEGDTNNDNLPPVASKVSSSCEIFNLFKIMAAGKGNQQSLAEEVDSDEDEGGNIQPSSESRTSTDSNATHVDAERHRSSSSATVKMGEQLYSDDEEDETSTMVGEDEHNRDGLRDWHQTHGQDTSEMDAQGSRLAG
jgi:hypothetical protein